MKEKWEECWPKERGRRLALPVIARLRDINEPGGKCVDLRTSSEKQPCDVTLFFLCYVKGDVTRCGYEVNMYR